MARIPSRGTNPELILRHALWHRGFRYRVNDKRLPGSPDIVLPKYKTVVFVHGCFWHGHKNCKNSRKPKTNIVFWETKISRNQERDQEVWRELESRGWSVVIVWECEIKKVTIEALCDRLEAEIKDAGERHKELMAARKKEKERQKLEKYSRKQKEGMCCHYRNKAVYQ